MQDFLGSQISPLETLQWPLTLCIEPASSQSQSGLRLYQQTKLSRDSSGTSVGVPTTELFDGMNTSLLEPFISSIIAQNSEITPRINLYDHEKWSHHRACKEACQQVHSCRRHASAHYLRTTLSSTGYQAYSSNSLVHPILVPPRLPAPRTAGWESCRAESPPFCKYTYIQSTGQSLLAY